MDERLRFIQDALSDRFTMAALCARYALAPGAALATTRYREMWVGQRQDTTRVQGVFVGVLVNGPSGWRIVSGNSSHAPTH